jgi:PAS domain S-box-containing protein
VAGQTVTILGFILELVSPNFHTKILWDQFQWLSQAAFIVAYLVFAFQFADNEIRYPKATWTILLGIPVIFNLLVVTDGLHHLIYPNPHLSAAYPFPELEYDFAGAVYIYSLYVYSATLYGIGLLIKRAFQPNNIHRLQFATMAIGFLIPVALSVFSLTDIKITAQRDSTPAFAIQNLIVTCDYSATAIDIVPIARAIVDDMSDPVIVLDPQNRVVDINRAALTLLGKKSSEVIGRTSRDAFARWPFVVEMLENPKEQRREVSTKSNGETWFFDISISPISNKQRGLLGHIVVARDITRHKNLEMNYRALSEQLEQHVHVRTEELRASSERYRAVVENQTEFIVRWKPDGIRTFVNEAYCRYFGISTEQALSANFMSLIAADDQQAVQEKISRLKSGITDVETDIHRVIKPDGSGLAGMDRPGHP